MGSDEHIRWHAELLWRVCVRAGIAAATARRFGALPEDELARWIDAAKHHVDLLDMTERAVMLASFREED
jgi:hypothetical protein